MAARLNFRCLYHELNSRIETIKINRNVFVENILNSKKQPVNLFN
jgi:hypothetical protein